MRNIVWTLSNLCRNKNPPPPFETIKPALPVFNHLLLNTDPEVLGKKHFVSIISHFLNVTHCILLCFAIFSRHLLGTFLSHRRV